MSRTGEKVDMLKKVTLTLAAGNASNPGDRGEDVLSMEFVYGVGPTGLTPFEYALADAEVGQTVTLQVDGGDFSHTFGHLQSMLPEGLEAGSEEFLRIRVERVEPAEQREVIRAMADASTCKDTCCGH